MSTVSEHVEAIVGKAAEYAEARAKLLKLKVVDKTSDTASDIASSGVSLLFILFFVLIASIGLALFLGELLGKNYYGFFVVAGVYGLVGLIIYANRKSFIKRPVSNFLIGKILNSKK